MPNAEKSSASMASRWGWLYGSGRITVWSSALNTAAFAPMPRARIATTLRVKAGARPSTRVA
jgi:hypothetical protein